MIRHTLPFVEQEKVALEFLPACSGTTDFYNWIDATELFGHGCRPCASKNGAYRGPIGQKKLGDFLVFSYIFVVFYGIFGVYIFPKWLKKVPGHIPILFG